MGKAASSQEAAGCKVITTFVQTETNAFREVVQRLTGPVGTTVGVKRTTSKLHERRQCTRPKLEIVKPEAINFKLATSVPPSPVSGNSSSLIPSPLTPSTIISRLSILDEEKKGVASILELDTEDEEEKAIKERRFYLHPSPRAKPGYPQPELLALFPLESPGTSG